MSEKKISRVTEVEKVFADDNHYTMISSDDFGYASLDLALKPIHNKDIIKNLETVAEELKKVGLTLTYKKKNSVDTLEIRYSRKNLTDKRTRNAGPKKKGWAKPEVVLEMHQLGMSQKEIAEKLGISQTSVSRRLKEAKEKNEKKK